MFISFINEMNKMVNPPVIFHLACFMRLTIFV